ncbi:hypothetical protein [Micromonospora sp. WMMD712]|uniref:hypothetical protein n=1 Tax=Micromonospora sp. WMMD712 TaxID=3016096 RepID=UPI00249A76B8|nr:hypothetical protein [Micromonospora sp. WMMD712]WFE57279.1 hypothetical protein O7633_10545 [Micromonospora sp. WMMD712]
MYAVVVRWSLADSSQTVESLQRHLLGHEESGVDRPVDVIAMTWIDDPAEGWWGAVLLGRSMEVMGHPALQRASTLIGCPPTDQWSFDLLSWTTGGQSRLTELWLDLLSRSTPFALRAA